MVFIGPDQLDLRLRHVFSDALFLRLHQARPRRAGGARPFFTHPAGPDATYAAALFHTGWFVESILTQTLIVHIIRTHRIPFIQSRASKTMSFTTVLIMAVGVWLPFSPVARYLGFVPLPPVFFIWLAALPGARTAS